MFPPSYTAQPQNKKRECVPAFNEVQDQLRTKMTEQGIDFYSMSVQDINRYMILKRRCDVLFTCLDEFHQEIDTMYPNQTDHCPVSQVRKDTSDVMIQNAVLVAKENGIGNDVDQDDSE